MNINIPSNDELFNTIKQQLESNGLTTEEGSVQGSLLSQISEQNSDILDQLREQIESYSTDGLSENQIDILYQIIGFPQEEQVNVQNVNQDLTADQPIKDIISYQDISNGIEVKGEGYTIKVDLNSINPIEQLTELEYNEVQNVNSLNINITLEYEENINIPEKTTIDINGQNLLFDKGYNAETDYSRTTQFISQFLGSFFENLLSNNISLRQFTPNKNMLIELQTFLSNVDLFKVEYIDQPRGNNSFDIILTPSKIQTEDIDIQKIRNSFDSFMPEYIDYRIIKPVYYNLDIDFDLQVDTDFTDEIFTDQIETYFENNYRNFIYYDFTNFVDKQDDIFQVNSITVNLQIQNTNNSIIDIGTISSNINLNEYKIFRTKNINITKAVV